MPHAKSITKRIHAQRTPLIIERDYPNSKLSINDPDYEEVVCRFCEQRFIEGHKLWKRTWEHLDNDSTNQQLWNLAWVHWDCNQKKKNDIDLQFMAQDILKQNQQWGSNHNFEFARARENSTEEHTEMDYNAIHTEIAEQFLTEKLPDMNKRYLHSDALNCIVFRCRNKTGHGSIQSVRNYLNVLSCSEGDYVIEKIEGKNYIRKSSKCGKFQEGFSCSQT